MIINRYKVTIVLFIAVFAIIIARLGVLHYVDRDFLQKQGKLRTVRELPINASRGVITDRNGQALAVSTRVASLWVNAQDFQADAESIVRVARIIEQPAKKLAAKLASAIQAGKGFTYLARHLTPEQGIAVKQLKLPGLHVTTEYRRFYPQAEVSAQLLGFTNIDQKGIEGIELMYNDWLEGQSGKKRVLRDALGQEVEQASISEASDGQDLALSLDERIQYKAYTELEAAVIRHKASSGSAVVLDVATGEVLAMVNNPSFNPNSRHKSHGENYRNAAVTDAFEPGSVQKIFSMASVLEHKNLAASTMVDTSPGILRLNGGVVRDVHESSRLDLAGVLKASSNIGISKLALQLQPEQLVDTYQRFGFGWSTNSGFPGESHGQMQHISHGQNFVQATMSFGYGLSTTALQLAQAYATIGAGGVKKPISYLKLDKNPEGVRVISRKLARTLLEMLEYTADHECSKARVAGYRVAGKTGTVRTLAKDGSYSASKHRAIFAGLAPAINPRLAIVVILNEPAVGGYYSNQVAAPVFAKIAEQSLRLLQVAPDLIDTHGVQVASIAKDR